MKFEIVNSTPSPKLNWDNIPPGHLFTTNNNPGYVYLRLHKDNECIVIGNTLKQKNPVRHMSCAYNYRVDNITWISDEPLWLAEI